MLRISKLTDYATVILARLAAEPARRFTAGQIASETRLAAPTVSKLLKQLHRRGLVNSTNWFTADSAQLDAVERSLAGDEDCSGQLMLLAAVHGGVNGLMGEILEDHIRFHLTDGAKERIAPELAEDLIELIRAYVK